MVAFEESAPDLEAQLVVIGSGGSGLAAAVTAAERGVSDIIVLEKRNHIGGNSARADGLFACESPAQKRLGITANADEYFKKAMRWAHWSRVNPRIIRAYVNKSGDTIRWFEEKGVDFQIPPSVPGGLPCLGADVWHLPTKGPDGTRAGARLVRVLKTQFKETGGRLLLGTFAKKILRGDSGEVNGLLASSPDGKELHISTHCVVIATGGFAANKELLRKYCPEFRDQILMDANGVPNMGDGLLLAEDAGSAIAETVSILKSGPIPEHKGKKNMFFLFTLLGTHALWVNKRGRRFVDEGVGYMLFESVNALLEQPDCVMYYLIDHNAIKNLALLQPEDVKRTSDNSPVSAVEAEERLREMAAEKDAIVKIADSWEEIADWIGADTETLRATVDSYNGFCERGCDEEFAKDKRLLLPVSEAPFYAVKGTPNMIDTTGGIKTSEYMEVLDRLEKPIPGLFAAGVIVDGFEGHTYAGELTGSALGFAMNSGRIAGESASMYICKCASA